MSVTAARAPVVVEPASQAFVEATAKPPFLYQRLRAVGVAVTTVRYDGITHDFMMLNPLSRTHATRAAIAQAISILRGAFYGT
jgi:acetyl esterase/lipase